MPTSLAVSRGRLLMGQIQALTATGAADTATGKVVVIPGSAIEDATRTLDSETRARATQGAASIPETNYVVGGFVNLKMGALEIFDLDVLLAGAVSLVSGVNQIGKADPQFGSAIDYICGTAGSGFSLIRWHEAISCGTCVGVWVEVLPRITVRSRPTDDNYSTGSPLGTSEWKFNYSAGATLYAQGPGNILPSGTPTGRNRYTFIQSPDTAVSPIVLKFPGATIISNGGFSCGLMPAGFLSGVHAVGGASNVGAGVIGANAAYA